MTRPDRLAELDSLRGLAALSVVFYHFKLLWDERTLSGITQLIYRGPLRLISPGTEAVVLFFILSGFVLSIPAIQGRAQPYPVFFIRRVFRIYLPYLAALALSVLGAATLHGYVPGTAWFHRTWSQPLDWHLVLQHVLFLGVYNSDQLNTAFWSLIVEMRVSLVFPALCALVLWLKPAQSALCAIFFSLSSWALLRGTPHMDPLLRETLGFVAVFIVGIYLARQQKQISQLYSSLSRAAKILIATACILLFVYAGTTLPLVILKVTGRSFGFLGEWLGALGGAGIVVFSLNSQHCRKVLLLQPVRFLGRVSYSMYLVHGTILFAFVHLLFGRMRLLLIFPFYFITVMVASAILYRFVEKPSMEWGRRISNLMLASRKTLPPLSATTGIIESPTGSSPNAPDSQRNIPTKLEP